MKKLILMVAAVLMYSAAGAQTYKVDKKALIEAIDKSDADIANPKRSQRAETWMQRGEAMFNAAAFVYIKVSPGLPVKSMLAALGKAEPIDTKVGENTFQVYSYPYADIYTANDMVQFWKEKMVVYEGAAQLALEAYKKAAEIDPKLAPKATEYITYIGDLYGIYANTALNFGEQEKAAELFMESFDVKKEPLVGRIDSVAINNAGSLYYNMKDYDRAIETYQKAIEYNVWEEGQVPNLLGYMYIQAEQYDKAKELYDKALALFPENKDLLESMVYYYRATGGDPNEMRNTLEKALAGDPENVGMWNGLAQIHYKSEDFDTAIEFFTKYVEKFPDSAEANFYLGNAWYLKGNELLKYADEDKTMSKASKDAALATAKDAYRQAWKYLHKSWEEKPDEVGTIERLTFVTYRIIEDPGMEKFYEKIEKEYKATL